MVNPSFDIVGDDNNPKNNRQQNNNASYQSNAQNGMNIIYVVVIMGVVIMGALYFTASDPCPSCPVIPACPQLNVSQFNFTVTDNNPIDKCWYNLGSGNSTPVNPVNFTLLSGTDGSNTWTVYCNDTLNAIGSGNVTFTTTNIFFNSQTYNLTTYETSTESFSVNLTYNSSDFNSISSKLLYNGTAYSGTQTGTGG